MADKTTCPKCAGRLIWNGSGMSCISCTFTTETEATKPRSEKKIASPKKGK